MVKSLTRRWLISLWNVIRIRHKLLTVRVSLVGSLHSTCERDLFRGRYPASSLCWSDVSSHLQSIVDLWSYLVPAGLTTSVSTVLGRNLSALCRSVGTTLVKERFWGQIAFIQIYLWWGGLSPFLFSNFSKYINVTYTILIPLFLWLHLKHSKRFQIFG